MYSVITQQCPKSLVYKTNVEFIISSWRKSVLFDILYLQFEYSQFYISVDSSDLLTEWQKQNYGV